MPGAAGPASPNEPLGFWEYRGRRSSAWLDWLRLKRYQYTVVIGTVMLQWPECIVLHVVMFGGLYLFYALLDVVWWHVALPLSELLADTYASQV